MCFLRNLYKNPQEKREVLVIAGLATKKVGVEFGLVPRLAGVAPPLIEQRERVK